MKSEIKKIVTSSAIKKKYKIHSSAYSEIKKYTGKWEPKFKKQWNTSLIEVALVDKASLLAGKEELQKGLHVVTAKHVKNAILGWHEESQLNKCYYAGLKIMRQARREGIKLNLGVKLQSYVTKNLI